MNYKEFLQRLGVGTDREQSITSVNNAGAGVKKEKQAFFRLKCTVWYWCIDWY